MHHSCHTEYDKLVRIIFQVLTQVVVVVDRIFSH